METQTDRKVISVEMDARVSIAEQVRRAKLDEVDELVSDKHFKLSEIGYREIELFPATGGYDTAHHQRGNPWDIKTDTYHMQQEIKQAGYVPATLEDALALSQMPRQEKLGTIVFLGTMFEEVERSPQVLMLFDSSWPASPNRRELRFCWSNNNGLGYGLQICRGSKGICYSYGWESPRRN